MVGSNRALWDVTDLNARFAPKVQRLSGRFRMKPVRKKRSVSDLPYHCCVGRFSESQCLRGVRCLPSGHKVCAVDPGVYGMPKSEGAPPAQLFAFRWDVGAVALS